MKNILLATLLAATVTAAGAVEVGVNTTRDFSGSDRSGFGLTVTAPVKGVDVTAGFDRFTNGVRQDRYSLTGAYNVASVGKATVALKAGGAYLHNQTGANGYAGLVGAGVSYPLTQKVSATVDYSYQFGQSRVSQFDGNRVTFGVKYAF